MAEHNIYRGGLVHVLSEESGTCIFKPAHRPVDGARVAELVRDTMDDPGATVVCHSTLFHDDTDNAICRGWYDRLADRDPILLLARAMGVLAYDPVPEKG
jgi:hypothetical protein